MGKFKNTIREIVRQTKLNIDPESIRMSWEHMSPYGITGWSERSVFDTNQRKVGLMKRDRLDQVIDFFGHMFRNYKRGIKEELCTHPEDKCWLELEGDMEYGFGKQYHCAACGGYLHKSDVVDRYTGGTKTVSEVCTYPAFIPHGYEEYTGEKFVKPYKPTDDTDFNMPIAAYVAILENIGFEHVLGYTFKHSHCGREREDAYHVYAHRDGWLLTFDTYTSDGGDEGFLEPSLNSVNLYYNWSKSTLDSRRPSICSGGFVRTPDNSPNDPIYVWSGYSDGREHLRSTMNSISKHATLMTKWEDNPIHWLASNQEIPNYRDFVGGWKGWQAEMNSMHRANYAKLPDWVKEMIGPIKI